MNYFEKLYNIEGKEKYLSAVVIEGKYAGSRAIWSEQGIYETTSDRRFWERVMPIAPEECSGQIIELFGQKVYFEKVAEQKEMVVCGCGHVSIQVIKIAKILGFMVTALDDREEFTKNALEAGADRVICAPYIEALEQIEGNKNTYFAIITRGHRYDRTCLEQVLIKKYAYVGMIGSKSRVGKQLKEMEEAGFDSKALEQVHTPIGLPIGAQTPEEIAVSILGEIIQFQHSQPMTTGFDKKVLLAVANRNEAYNASEKALVTIVKKTGSGPREVGTKMVICEDGTVIGTIGGGTLELDMQKKALECIRRGENLYLHYDMPLREAEEDGMACGGTADLYIEVVSAKQIQDIAV